MSEVLKLLLPGPYCAYCIAIILLLLMYVVYSYFTTVCVILARVDSYVVV